MDVAERLQTGAIPASDPRETAPARILVERWLALLVALDLLAGCLAVVSALQFRFGDIPAHTDGTFYSALPLAIPLAWLGILTISGAYDKRFICTTSDQYRTVINAGTTLLAVIGVAALVLRLPVSREVVAWTLVWTVLLSLLARYGTRRAMVTRLRSGAAVHSVLLVGTNTGIAALGAHIASAPTSGFRVAGQWRLATQVKDAEEGAETAPDFDELKRIARRLGVDTVAIAGADALPVGGLRRLSWDLEGTGIQLVVAPALTDFAGPRIVIRPVAGLPLLHIDEPEFSGVRKAAKNLLDRIGASLLLLLFSPLLIAIAFAILATERLEPFFKQVRVGYHGREFVIWKFRTMRRNAESELNQVVSLNQQSGPLFKIREDPRVTRLGRWLRRLSIDELPQLWNVLNGSMSLVGPRPALPTEVASYEADVRRRLLVKPGITGLWQINGRADLSWEDSVRLDLFYVENWSPMLDIVILAKTIGAVVSARGAY